MNDIWFNLCLGNIETGEEGSHKYSESHSRLSRLSAFDIKSVKKYREYLHKLLDKAIDEIEENLTRSNKQ